MAKHLHFVSRPLHLHIQAKLGLNHSTKQTLALKDKQWLLDPITHIARIQGIALFNQIFFEVLNKKSFKDPESQWKVYSKLVIDRQYIIEVCKHSNLLEAFKINTIVKGDDASYGEVCFTALCVILWDIHCQKEVQATQIIRNFIEHYIAQLFPKKKHQSETQENIVKEISKLLYQQWGIKPEIRESFKTDDDSVEFSLIARTHEYHPAVLITVKDKRLKPTRKKAYRTLLDLLKSDFYEVPKLVFKTTKKKMITKPLEY